MGLTQLEKALLSISADPVTQSSKSLQGLVVVHTDGQCFTASHHDDKISAAGYRRVDQVALQQNIMLGQNRYDDDRIL